MKVHLLFCILFVIRSGYSLSKFDNLCFTRHGDYLPHPNDCRKFIRCSHGKAYEFQCPGNLKWRQEVKSCDYAYRSKCELNITSKKNVNSALKILKNSTKNGFSNTATDKSDIICSSTVLIVETATAVTTDFNKIAAIIPNNLSTGEPSTSVTQQYISSFTVEHLAEQDNITFDSITELSTSESSVSKPKQYINNFTTEQSTEKDYVEFIAQSEIYSTELSKTSDVFYSASQMLYSVSGLSTTVDSTTSVEQLIDNTTADYLMRKNVELSTAEDSLILTDEYIDNLTTPAFRRLITELSLTKHYRDNITEITLQTDNITESSAAENNRLEEMFFRNVTTENTKQLSTITYTLSSIEPFDTNSTAFNVTDKITEENIINSTESILELSTEQNLIHLNTNRFEIPTDSLKSTADLEVNLQTESAKESVAEEFVVNLTDKSNDYSELLTEEFTTQKPSVHYNRNTPEILKDITGTVTLSTTDTTTEIVYTQLIETTNKPIITQDNNKENMPDFLNHNKYGKKPFISINELLTSSLRPSFNQSITHSTTTDPRLPFRAYECQGENNRQLLKALKCYQYYQCFAGWAFLLNCHEGWWFQPDMKRCVRIEDNECGY